MKKTSIIFLLFVFLFVCTSCNRVQNIFSKGNGSGRVQGEIRNNEPVRLVLYYPDKTFSNLIPEERYASFKNSPEETILSELLKGSKTGSPFAFPRGTKLLSIKRTDGTIIINFSGEFIKNFSGDEKVVLMTIYSIVNSLTEMPGVKRVEIRVKDKLLDTLGDKIKIPNPLTRNRELFIRNRVMGPGEVLNKQLTLERAGKWFEAYFLYADEENNLNRKYYHDYVKEMEEVSGMGFTNQDFEIGDYSLDSTGNKARVKVNFYTPMANGERVKSADIYFNCVKINNVWMVDWLTAQ